LVGSGGGVQTGHMGNTPGGRQFLVRRCCDALDREKPDGHRLCFIAACLRDEEPMSGLCARFGISRKTGHKWLERYHEAGAAVSPIEAGRVMARR
jgi:hypothetical protein